MRVAFKSYDKILPLSELRKSEYQRNKHPKAQVKRLAKIMREHGVRHPIHISNLSGQVCFGHGRWEAAKLNGWKKFPVVYQDFKSKEEEWSSVQSDNAIAAWAELDLEAIEEDLEFFKDFDEELLGIESLESSEDKEPNEKEDEIPESAPQRVNKNDIYILGNHRLLCGDSTDINQVKNLFKGKKADLVFTSPPYNGNTGLTTSKIIKGKKVYEGKTLYRDNSTDNKTSKEYLEFNDLIFQSFEAILKKEANVFYNINYNKKSRSEWLKVISNAIDRGFNLFETIVWKKKGMPNPASDVMTRDWEFIFLLNQSSSYRTNKEQFGFSTNFWEVSNQGTQIKEHKACFPVGLPEKAIIETSLEEDLIYDPFGGSGTTLIAAEKTERTCYMVELDPRYCDVILKRWEDYTGKKARKLEKEKVKTKKAG